VSMRLLNAFGAACRAFHDGRHALQREAQTPGPIR